MCDCVYVCLFVCLSVFVCVCADESECFKLYTKILHNMLYLNAANSIPFVLRFFILEFGRILFENL